MMLQADLELHIETIVVNAIIEYGGSIEHSKTVRVAALRAAAAAYADAARELTLMRRTADGQSRANILKKTGDIRDSLAQRGRTLKDKE